MVVSIRHAIASGIHHIPHGCVVCSLLTCVHLFNMCIYTWNIVPPQSLLLAFISINIIGVRIMILIKLWYIEKKKCKQVYIEVYIEVCTYIYEI